MPAEAQTTETQRAARSLGVNLHVLNASQRIAAAQYETACPQLVQLPHPHFGNGTCLDPLRHGAINCAIEQSSELGDNDLSKMAREARAPSEIHPNLNEW